MIGISKLYCGTVEASDPLRYGRASKELPSHLLQFSEDKKPVVVWNVTSACNLACVHCYASAGRTRTQKELSLRQGFELIEDLAGYGSPVILFSGGEPLLRKDLPELIEKAVKLKIRAVISTNGTLITQDLAMELSDFGLSYIGVSLDGIGEVNDSFRGVPGSFKAAMKGIYNAMHEGIKVGLRFTMNKRNVSEIPRILDLIMDRTKEMIDAGRNIEVLTVDNHADGPYVYLRMKAQGNPRAHDVLELLKMNGGNSSGLGIGCINWDGEVYPDQFWRHQVLGNINERRFSEIWEDKSNELLMKLKSKKDHVTGRCRSCRWLSVCAGNFRARAEAATGNPWGVDPACYLSDEEIS